MAPEGGYRTPDGQGRSDERQRQISEIPSTSGPNGALMGAMPTPMYAIARRKAFDRASARLAAFRPRRVPPPYRRSEEHTSELQSRGHLVCRLPLENKKIMGNCGLPLRGFDAMRHSLVRTLTRT